MTWRERIQSARERGRFTAEERALAQSWTTCAVGEQRRQMPSVIVSRPTRPHPETDCQCFECLIPADLTIAILGDGNTGFYHAVLSNNFKLAETRLDAIEDRALELKRQWRDTAASVSPPSPESSSSGAADGARSAP